MKYSILKLNLVILLASILLLIVFFTIVCSNHFNEQTSSTDNLSQEQALALIVSKFGSEHYNITNYIFDDCVLAWKQAPVVNICKNRANGVRNLFSSLDLHPFSLESTLVRVRKGEDFEVISVRAEPNYSSGEVSGYGDLSFDELDLETPRIILSLEDFLEHTRDRKSFFSSYVNFCDSKKRYSERASFYLKISNDTNDGFSVLDLKKTIIHLAKQCKLQKGG